jgi:hypothetical protein
MAPVRVEPAEFAATVYASTPRPLPAPLVRLIQSTLLAAVRAQPGGAITSQANVSSEVRREDGSVVGGGSYVVSEDGRSMLATTFGYDTQLRQFQTQTAWDRE